MFSPLFSLFLLPGRNHPTIFVFQFEENLLICPPVHIPNGDSEILSHRAKSPAAKYAVIKRPGLAVIQSLDDRNRSAPAFGGRVRRLY